MWSVIHTVSVVFWRLVKKSLGGGLYHIKLVPVTGVIVTCVEPICFYRVKPISSIRPSSPGLTWGALSRIMFGLRRSRKYGMALLLSCAVVYLLSFWKAHIFLCSEGKGVMVWLHGENTMDLAIWSFL